jgi:hypothetical protein
MKMFGNEGQMTLPGEIAIGIAASAAVLGALFVEQIANGENPCEPSASATSWITVPVCEIPAAVLGLSASDTPQTARP